MAYYLAIVILHHALGSLEHLALERALSTATVQVTPCPFFFEPVAESLSTKIRKIRISIKALENTCRSLLAASSDVAQYISHSAEVYDTVGLFRCQFDPYPAIQEFLLEQIGLAEELPFDHG